MLRSINHIHYAYVGKFYIRKFVIHLTLLFPVFQKKKNIVLSDYMLHLEVSLLNTSNLMAKKNE